MVNDRLTFCVVSRFYYINLMRRPRKVSVIQNFNTGVWNRHVMSTLLYASCMHRWTRRKQIKRIDPKRVYPSGTEGKILQGICDITPLNSLGLEVGHWASSNSKIRPFSKRSKPPRSFDQIFERLFRLMVSSGKQ